MNADENQARVSRGAPSSNSSLTKLIEVMGSQKSLTGLSKVLEVIAEAMDCQGCIFWEQSVDGKLFILAASVPKEWEPVIHYLDENSYTAQAIRNCETIWVSGLLKASGGNNPDHEFIRRNGMRSFATTPIHLNSGAHAAINVYRTNHNDFESEEIGRLRELAAPMPNLYTSLIDRVGFGLLSRSHLFDDASDNPEGILQTLIEGVAQTFNCREASIFLVDRHEEPGVFRLKATYWDWPDDQPRSGFILPSSGATRYAVEHKRKVHVLDLADEAAVERQYSGLKWQDSWNIQQKANLHLDKGPHGQLQPITFMAVPICFGSYTSGVIRCCAARSAPYYFDPREVEFLSLVAERIGAWWDGYLHRKQERQEVEMWRRVVEQISDMNGFVTEELGRPAPDEHKIFRRALELVKEVFADAGAFGIRLFDAEREDLYFSDVVGEAWEKHPPKGNPRYRRFPLSGTVDSAGAWVWKNKDVYLTQDAPADQISQVIFRGTTRDIAAPIMAGTQLHGVLDIISFSPKPFGQTSKPVARLLGRQIGLYHDLALRIQEIRQFESERLERVEREKRTFENFEHQLRTPVMKAYRRAWELVRENRSRGQFDRKLLVLRSLCRQADRVARNLRFFTQLSEDGPLLLRENDLTSLTHQDLLAYLREAAEDQGRQVHSRKKIEFYVDEKSFDDLYRVTVRVNMDLLEQAVGNLLDNAAKYSYTNTRVKIGGGLTHQQEFFFISVSNVGYPIRDVRKLTMRGYRGDEALNSEGSGIGLWIAKKIMDAHRGRLDIHARSGKVQSDLQRGTAGNVFSGEGHNEFRLAFPKNK